MRTAYADATGRIFLIAGLIAILTFVAVALMPVTELRTTIRKVEDPADSPDSVDSDSGPDDATGTTGKHVREDALV